MLDEVKVALDEQIELKGDAAFASSHETLGVLYEEFDEFGDAVRDRTNIDAELMDVVVAALWGLASHRQGAWTW